MDMQRTTLRLRYGSDTAQTGDWRFGSEALPASARAAWSHVLVPALTQSWCRPARAKESTARL